MIDNRIYDPCFGDQGAAGVVCGSDPSKNDSGFLLQLTAPLPAPALPGDTNQAWLVELADGTVCGFATGATAVVNGQRINYLCQTSQTTGPVPVLLGDLHPGTVWTAQKATLQPGANGLTVQSSGTVAIQTVWR
jgi:hypothetical protein